MKPSTKWIKDWRLGEDTKAEANISAELVTIFADFWDGIGLDAKSKTTKNRYSNALHALGGYLIEQAMCDEDSLDLSATELLDANLTDFDGPLVCPDDERWQDEIDMVCRKLYRYMAKR